MLKFRYFQLFIIAIFFTNVVGMQKTSSTKNLKANLGSFKDEEVKEIIALETFAKSKSKRTRRTFYRKQKEKLAEASSSKSAKLKSKDAKPESDEPNNKNAEIVMEVLEKILPKNIDQEAEDEESNAEAENEQRPGAEEIDEESDYEDEAPTDENVRDGVNLNSWLHLRIKMINLKNQVIGYCWPSKSSL